MTNIQLNIVLFSLLQIVDTLDELIDRKKEPETMGLRDMTLNKNTWTAILVLCDMLNPVNIFCKYLQGGITGFRNCQHKTKGTHFNISVNYFEYKKLTVK